MGKYISKTIYDRWVKIIFENCEIIWLYKEKDNIQKNVGTQCSSRKEREPKKKMKRCFLPTHLFLLIYIYIYVYMKKIYKKAAYIFMYICEEIHYKLHN